MTVNNIHQVEDTLMNNQLNNQGAIDMNNMSELPAFGNPSAADVLATAAALASFDFSAYSTADGANTVEVSDEIAEKRKAVAFKLRADQQKWAERAISYLATGSMVEQLGGRDSVLGRPLFEALVEQAGWLLNSTKYLRKYMHAIDLLTGEGSKASVLFEAFLRDYLAGWKIEPVTADKKVLRKIDLKTKEILEESDMSDSPLIIKIRRTGIHLSVKVGENNIIKPTEGRQYVFESNFAATFGPSIINKNLTAVLRSIRIHDENVKEDNITQTSETVLVDKVYKFRQQDALFTLLLTKINNIDLSPLFKSVNENEGKILVLRREFKNKGAKSLSPVVAPAHTFARKYGMTGVVSTSQAKVGYVSPMTSIARMVEFITEADGNITVRSRENINKTISRVDKLNEAKALWTANTLVFVALDTTAQGIINQSLAVGNMMISNDWAYSNGACRVVSDMDNCGIKSATAPLRMIDSKQAAKLNVQDDVREYLVKRFGAESVEGGLNMVGASAVKGGLLSVFGSVIGNPNYLRDLSIIVAKGNSELVIKDIASKLETLVHTIEVAGQQVRGVFTMVPLQITNAYTVDMHMVVEDEDDSLDAKEQKVVQHIQNMIDEMETAQKPLNGLRAKIAEEKAKDANFSVVAFLKQGLSEGRVQKKPLWTRVISQEIQSVAAWYGKDVAVQWLSELADIQLNKGVDITKYYALQFLGALPAHNVTRLSVKDILAIITPTAEQKLKLERNNSLYLAEVGEKLLNIFNKDGWVELEYQDGTVVNIPCGRVCVDDLAEQLEETSSFIVTRGLLNDVLENIKAMVNKDGKLFATTDNHKKLELLIQKTLLGKAFAYQTVKGYYGVLLPLVGKREYALTTAAITNRNRLLSKEERKENPMWFKMVLSKAPQYFKGSTASYDVFNLNLGEDLDFAFECAIFVNPDVVLMQQNDFDGDMMRISVGATSLPYVAQLGKEFNGKFFSDFVAEEYAGNVLKAKKGEVCTLEEYHQAVYSAIKAKDSVGSFTANSYFFEAAMPNLLGKVVTGILSEDEYQVSQKDYYQATALLKMLIQVEAMNNIKQDVLNVRGEVKFITEMMSYWTLRRLSAYGDLTLEQVVSNHYVTVHGLIEALCKKYDIKLESSDILRMFEIMYSTSVEFKIEEMLAMNIFRDRAVGDKAQDELTNHLADKKNVAYEGVYSFAGKFDAIMNGKDQESMYYEILVKTLDVVETVLAADPDDETVAGFRF